MCNCKNNSWRGGMRPIKPKDKSKDTAKETEKK